MRVCMELIRSKIIGAAETTLKLKNLTCCVFAVFLSLLEAVLGNLLTVVFILKKHSKHTTG